jgi:hypothetical protein
MSNNSKIIILYSPDYEKGEKEIFERIFRKNGISLEKYNKKGMVGVSYDVQFIIEFLSDPKIRQVMVGTYLLLVKELFNRLRKNTSKERPRYTVLVIKKESSYISISNSNEDNKLKILYVKNAETKMFTNYSEEEFKRILEE